MPHLVSTTTTPRHLGAVTYAGENHLVSVRQRTSWSGRTFTVTPSAARWSAAIGTGVQAFPGHTGGAELTNDTNQLVDALRAKLDSASWRTGYHPVWNYFARGQVRGPYAARAALPAGSCECGYSFAAYRYTLHRLHFSRMVSGGKRSYSAFVRAYVPSKLLQTNASTNNIYYSTLEQSAFWYGTSKLQARLYGSIPTMSATVADGGDAWEMQGAANNGETGIGSRGYHSLAYNLRHGDDVGAMPVWTPNDRTGKPGTAPAMYYHDFQLTSEANLSLLDQNPPIVWLSIGLSVGNGFSSPTAGAGLGPNAAACCWIYRADLVLKCTSGAFT